MKRILALVIAVLMAVAVCPVAFASPTPAGTITVLNAVAGKEYNAYKIFDLEMDDPSAPTSFIYRISSDSVWYTTVSNYAATTANGLTLTSEGGTPETFLVTIGASFSAAAFAAELKRALENDFPDPATAPSPDGTDTPTGTTASIPVPSFGYYFVTSSLGATCALDSVSTSVTIYEKNGQPPFDKTATTPNAPSVEVGQTVTFTITGEVPSTVGYTDHYIWRVIDTMSNGLTMNRDVTVTVGTSFTYTSDQLVASSELIYNPAGIDNKFMLQFDIVGNHSDWAVGDPIVITYTAVVNENAITNWNSLKNEATLQYSNDPTDGNQTTSGSPDVVELHTTNLKIHKENNSGTVLAGATFKLYKLDGATKYYYRYVTSPSADVDWTDDPALADEFITNSSGEVPIIGLGAGTYYLEETVAPQGYNLLTTPVTIEIVVNTSGSTPVIQVSYNGGTPVDVTSVDGIPVTVVNNAGSELPATGGIGTRIFYIVGGILMATAVVVFVTRKRMQNKD